MIDHLSASQIDMFYRCGEQWKRRYIDDEKLPPGVAAHVGTGLHGACEYNFKTKIETKEDQPLDALTDCAVEYYQNSLDRGVFFLEEEKDNRAKVMQEGEKTVVDLTELARREFMPSVTPKLVEEKMFCDLPGVEVPVLGYLDLYTEDDRLLDIKTSGRKWAQSRADISTQPTIYREMINQNMGHYPSRITFDIFISTKERKYQTLETTRGQDDLTVLANRTKTMLRMIQAGLFPPSDPSAWQCSVKFCGYYQTCPYTNYKVISIGEKKE